ncbi:hypothetical protein [uncultured Gammaproteobacteria bacterium]|jgi:hypothetical protein|nr:hypothetical protein [uncultured Gammaproteobacteria bacterium]VVM22374.1 hypothetical protein BSPWISOXPB_5661 [uncultured Gammaproteobacteria bacterium]
MSYAKVSHLFDSVESAQNLTTQWLWVYNNERPHFALGGIPLRWRNKMTVNSQASTLELYGKWGYYKYAQTNDLYTLFTFLIFSFFLKNFVFLFDSKLSILS